MVGIPDAIAFVHIVEPESSEELSLTLCDSCLKCTPTSLLCFLPSPNQMINR
jgi:hypothetical protein